MSFHLTVQHSVVFGRQQTNDSGKLHCTRPGLHRVFDLFSDEFKRYNGGSVIKNEEWMQKHPSWIKTGTLADDKFLAWNTKRPSEDPSDKGFILIPRPVIPQAGLKLKDAFANSAIYVVTSKGDDDVIAIMTKMGETILSKRAALYSETGGTSLKYTEKQVENFIGEYHTWIDRVLREVVGDNFVSPATWSVPVRVVSDEDAVTILELISLNPELELGITTLSN